MEGILNVSRPALLPIALLTIIYCLFPASETSGGGNYNLRYLTAQTRRELSPAVKWPVDTSIDSVHIPTHAIIPLTPISLYIQAAGFLWAGRKHDTNGKSASRAYFSDPLNRRYPWEFQQVLSGMTDRERREARSNTDYSAYIWSGEHVLLRSGIHDSYLAVNPITPNIEGDTEDQFTASEQNGRFLLRYEIQRQGMCETS